MNWRIKPGLKSWPSLEVGPPDGLRMWKGKRDRPYPRLISMRDRGSRSRGSSRRNKGSGK